MSAAASVEAPGGGAGPVRDDLLRLLTALVKLALVGDTGDTARWRDEALAAQKRVAGAKGDTSALRLDALWSRAVKTAESDPAVRRDETVNPTLPTMAPLRVDQLVADPFDLDEAVHAIRDTASFG